MDLSLQGLCVQNTFSYGALLPLMITLMKYYNTAAI